MTSDHKYFELRRLSDGLVYQFDQMTRSNGEIAYKRRDMDLWIVFTNDLGWVAIDEESRSLSGRPWEVLPQAQGNHPPEGEWVSKKGVKSYVYELKYLQPPA